MEGELITPKEPNAVSTVYAVPLAIIIAGVMIAGAIIFSRGTAGPSAAIGDQNAPEQVDVELDELVDNDPSMGDPDAPVTIVEFSDFQCPFCRSFFSTTYQQLKKDYVDTGKVRFVFRDFPLEFHAAAFISALASECANEQGRFWDYHDRIFEEQAKQGNGTITYGESELKQWASDIGLDTGEFNSCLSSQRFAQEVKDDFSYGQSVGVSGTPSFYVNDRLLIGAQPYSEFKALIDAAL